MVSSGGTHEDLSREQAVKRGSERSFGLVFAGFFLVVGLFPLVRGGDGRWWAVGLALAFAAVALAAPRHLRPLNALWFRFGLALGRVVAPVVMAALYFLVVTPTGVLMRAVGKDPLRLRFDPSAKSYWIARDPPGPAPESLKNQF